MTEDITGEYYRSSLMNFVLGGAFNSRINLNLCEDKGYTYGTRSGFQSGKLSGYYTASAEVRADATAASIVEFVNEITRYANEGITDDELSLMAPAASNINKLGTPSRVPPASASRESSSIASEDLGASLRYQESRSQPAEKAIMAIPINNRVECFLAVNE